MWSAAPASKEHTRQDQQAANSSSEVPSTAADPSKQPSRVRHWDNELDEMWWDNSQLDNFTDVDDEEDTQGTKREKAGAPIVRSFFADTAWLVLGAPGAVVVACVWCGLRRKKSKKSSRCCVGCATILYNCLSCWGAFVMALDVFLKGSFNSAEHRVMTPVVHIASASGKVSVRCVGGEARDVSTMLQLVEECLKAGGLLITGHEEEEEEEKEPDPGWADEVVPNKQSDDADSPCKDWIESTLTNSAQQNGTTSTTDRQNGTSDRYGQTSSRRTSRSGYVQLAYVQPSLPPRNYRETRNGYSSPLRTTHRTDITGHPPGTRTLPAAGNNAKFSLNLS
eukprot:g77755.t1